MKFLLYFLLLNSSISFAQSTYVGMELEIVNDIHLGQLFHNKDILPLGKGRLENIGPEPFRCQFQEYRLYDRRFFEIGLGILQNDAGALGQGKKPIIQRNWGSVLNKGEIFRAFKIEKNSKSILIHLKNTSYWSIPEKAYLTCTSFEGSSKNAELSIKNILKTINTEDSYIDYTHGDTCKDQNCPEVDNIDRNEDAKLDSSSPIQKKGVKAVVQ
jgi:hypothetical protein